MVRIENRNPEWNLVRRTASLGDLVDEVTFMEMCGVTSKHTFRQWAVRRGVMGIEFPMPIFRPDNRKGIWLKEEAKSFARQYKAKKATRGKK